MLVDWSNCPNHAAVTGYTCAKYAVIPPAGLILGPIALIFGFIGWLRVKRNPSLQGNWPAVVAMFIGSLTLITNWVGLALIVIGLTAPT